MYENLSRLALYSNFDTIIGLIKAEDDIKAIYGMRSRRDDSGYEMHVLDTGLNARWTRCESYDGLASRSIKD